MTVVVHISEKEIGTWQRLTADVTREETESIEKRLNQRALSGKYLESNYLYSVYVSPFVNMVALWESMFLAK